jgi:hypothetical protein
VSKAVFTNAFEAFFANNMRPQCFSIVTYQSSRNHRRLLDYTFLPNPAFTQNVSLNMPIELDN